MHRDILEHPEISQIRRTGYPSCIQEEAEDYDEDAAFEERRERELFGE